MTLYPGAVGGGARVGSWYLAGPSAAPLAQVALQAGNVSAPLKADPAQGNTNTQAAQRSVVMGETVPIVFTRRLGKDGGVMLQPGATEAAFSVNSSTNAITAKYHLVLGEGQMYSVQRRDVMQIGLRRGTFSQTYNKRAGDWTPGNTIPIPTSGVYRVASYNCGGGSSGYGTYSGLTTFSFITTCPDGDDSWKGQVSIFIRGGLQVTRLADGQTGPSSNVVDLIQYLLTQTSRVPTGVIDSSSLAAAATFIDVNLFRWDGVISESTNLRDWLAKTLPYYLLREASANGKFALRPLVPVDSGGAIKTGAITPAFTFDDSSVIGGSFEIEYIPLADRKPVCLQMQWRQQDECQWPLVRTSEVRYRGQAESGPYEQHDLSYCCTNENHAIKAGTYILARRRYVTHSARVSVRPGAASRALVAGDVIQITLTREASTGSTGAHNKLYEVQSIRKEASGVLGLDLLHFPVDSQGRSLVARDVAAATGTGLLLDPNTEGAPDDYSCDDNSVPADDSLPTSSWPKIPESYFSGGSLGSGLESAPAAGSTTPDPLGEAPRIGLPYGRPPAVGETITAPTICANPRYQWLKAKYETVNGVVWQVIDQSGVDSTAGQLTFYSELTGTFVTVVITCDGSTPSPTNGTILAPTLPGKDAPSDPYGPLPPYSVQLKGGRIGDGPGGGTYNSYGPHGIDVGGSIASMWITNSAGVKTTTGQYFLNYAFAPSDGVYFIWYVVG
jgi:hypothetical protein